MDNNKQAETLEELARRKGVDVQVDDEGFVHFTVAASNDAVVDAVGQQPLTVDSALNILKRMQDETQAETD